MHERRSKQLVHLLSNVPYVPKVPEPRIRASWAAGHQGGLHLPMSPSKDVTSSETAALLGPPALPPSSCSTLGLTRKP
jgi:hypothetical protein